MHAVPLSQKSIFLSALLIFCALFAVLVQAQEDLDPYRGKVAFVTGTSSGLGKELAKLAADHQMKIVLVDIDLEPSQVLAKEFRSRGLDAIAVKADLAIHEERVNAVKAAKEEFGRIDYLLNNAGYSYLARLDQMDLDQAHHLFEVNYWAYVDLAEQIIPMMKEQGGGTILNVASILGLIPANEGMGHYSASKHALVGMFQAAAKELKPHNIKVFVASPGGMGTNIAKNSVGPMADPAKNRAANWEDPAIPAKDIFEAMQKDQVVFRPGYVGRASRE